MKIYTIALVVFMVSAFSAAFTQVGVFDNVYTHTSEVDFDLENETNANIQLESGNDMLSGTDLLNLNSDAGGATGLFSALSRFYSTIDMALNSDKLIMEFTPITAHDVIQPFANIFGWITKILYGIGIISFLRRYRVS